MKGQTKSLGLMLMIVIFVVLAMLVNSLPFDTQEKSILYTVFFIFIAVFVVLTIWYF